LIDSRFSGIARGVGTSKIVGRIHVAQLQIGNDYFPTSFNVLEDAGVDMLFGLDMLKRHQCIIDLQKNALIIGTTGTTTSFLPESELPEARHHGGPTSPGGEDRQLAEALERSAAEAEAASLSASVAASNVRRSVSPVPPSANASEAVAGNVEMDQTASEAVASNTEPQQAAAQQTAAASNTAESGVSQESVERLMAMGFQREDVVKALTNSSGNVDKAALALIASSLPAPPPTKKK